MESQIKVINYEKLVDELYYLGSNFIMKFNVILNKKNEDGTRRNYHSEYSYNSNKYSNVNTLYTMKRSFNYYISIEYMGKENDTFIQIRVQDIMKVNYALEQAYKWFNHDSDIFMIDNDKLSIVTKVEPINIGRLSGDMGIVIEPIVINYEDMYYEGVRIYLNRTDNYVDMTIDKFSGLVYLLSNINMYQSAQLLLNYNGRLDYGENLINFSSNSNNQIGQDVRSQTITKAPRSNTRKRRFIPGTFKEGIDDL